ncbi:MAG: biotin synthase [Rhizobacter sp.]|nr:biotin synthase [Rhizobacter sp.]
MSHIVKFPLSPVDTTASRAHAAAVLRWSVADVNALFEQPFMDLLFRAQQVHREHFNASEVQLATPLSTETDGCSGGIVGMGESRAQRAGLVAQLANLEPYPESVPINHLARVEGTAPAGTEPLDPFEFVRMIAAARVTMPRAVVRLSAGREPMDEALRVLCFAAGANSIFYGDELLATGNPHAALDLALFERLGFKVSGAAT